MLENTVDYDEIRLLTSLYMAVIVKIRPFYGTVFGVYGSGSSPHTTRRQYGRNTASTERGDLLPVYGRKHIVYGRCNGWPGILLAYMDKKIILQIDQ
jgi:hypothetical protein